jgi:hypothetical protein
MRTFEFYKEGENWFIDLPEWEGSKAELAMVSGADAMLDIISEGTGKARLTISLQEFTNSDALKKLNDTPEIGGARYIMSKYKGIEYNLEMWLCAVTEWLFGYMPDNIYIA